MSYRDDEVAPYHNAIHAADVLQSMHALLLLGGVVSVSQSQKHLVGGTC